MTQIIINQKKNHTKIFLFTILDMLLFEKYLKIYSVNPLYLIFGKVNGYFQEMNRNSYLTLFPTYEGKEKNKTV